MCTASWSVGQGRLSLCFNRDELKTRGEALAPQVIESGSVRLLAAIDADAGGTWLAVNEFGLCVFLLNNYAGQALLAEPPKDSRTRGELPLRFAAYPRRSLAVEVFSAASLVCYNPFLIAFADTEAVEMYSWDGEKVERLDPSDGFATTSSFRTDAVQQYRKSQYQQLLAGRRHLEEEERRAFHIAMPHPDPAFNPMMLREESRTHSVSSIEVDEASVRFRYEAVLGESRQLGVASLESFSRKC